MQIIDTAYAVQIVGIVPLYGLGCLRHFIANQSYIPGIPGAADKIRFGAHLLFRAELVNVGFGPMGVLDQRKPHTAQVSVVVTLPVLIRKDDLL